MTTHDRRYTYAMLGVLGLALFLRLHYLWYGRIDPLEWDQLNYTKLALQLLDKGIYAYRDTMPNTLVTPGLPMFLTFMFGVFGHDPLEPTLMLIRYVQCFIGLGAVWFIYLIGRRLFHPAAGLIAALMAAVYPSYVWSASLILTEVLFLTCFTALLYVQVRIIQENRSRDHLWAGFLLGMTVLIRPNVLPLAAVPYLFLWVRHRRLFVPLILRGVGAFALVMLPWWIRNAVTFHAFIPVARGEAGNPFLGGTDPYFMGTIDWSRVPEEGQFALGLERVRAGLREDPWLWIRWFTVGKFKVFFRTLWVGMYPPSVYAWYYAFLNKLHFVIVYAGLAVLPMMTLRGSRPYAYLTVCLTLFWGIHQIFIPVDRYLYGMLPFLMLGVSGALVGVVRFVSVKSQLALQRNRGFG
ncbi:ArnT family glycosyltransferase [Gorillibacterium sp. sgz5001074]|uniref:ArnT family glycosyltransferase n=1 Tax=Gorillibacterium sp. sgz5001074 TaxID=3446695 RepID=UPI003F67E565